MPAVLALGAALTYGFADFLGGLATRKANVAAITLITNLAGAVLAVFLVFTVDGEWTTQTVGWGIAAGLGGLVGVVLLYQGLADGPNRLVSPLSAVVSAIVPIVVGITFEGRPGTLAILGLAIAPIAIWLVAGGDISIGEASKRPLALGIGAGLGFGTSFACYAQSPEGAGAVPLLTARATSLSLLIVAAFLIRPGKPAPPIIGVAVVAGILDMSANGLFLWSTIGGDLAIVGALVSLFPAPTVLLAVAFLGERLDRKQTAGLVLAIITAALLG